MLLSDERVDNIMGTSQAVAVTDEVQIVPANSPFEVLLDEVPLQEEPTSVTGQIVDRLDGAVTDSAGTITVENGGWFEDGDTLLVDTEQMTVNAAPTGNTVPVDRGANGTTPAAHSDGADVGICSRGRCLPRNVKIIWPHDRPRRGEDSKRAGVSRPSCWSVGDGRQLLGRPRVQERQHESA